MPTSISLGNIFGVRVDIHFSLFLIVAFISWSLATGFLPDQYPNWELRTYWITGLVSALSLFVSVLLHEFAHSLAAQRRGYPVDGITLFILGGVSNLRSEANKAIDEFVISIVGPLTSLAIAGIIRLAVVIMDGSSPIIAVFDYVSWINLALAVFNMLPAFPLDGGRVLRSAIWAVTGSFDRATNVSTRGGQIVGILLMALGALAIFQGLELQGIWAALVGWFLYNAATGNRSGNEFERLLEGSKVRDVMDASPPTIGPTVTIYDAVFDHLLHRGTRALPVCEGDRLLGIISMTDVKDVPQQTWRDRLVQDEMTRAPLRGLGPEDALYDALSLLGENGIHQAPVIVGERLVGLLSRAHIIQYFHQMGELGIK